VASVGFAAKSNLHPPADDWWRVNAYEVLAFCYQFGVLLSRSSISLIKIKRVDFMTLLQGGNFAIWQIQALVNTLHHCHCSPFYHRRLVCYSPLSHMSCMME
jgi:hypothetical protein